MSNFKAIIKRELNAYIATQIALIFLVVFLMLTGFFTFKLGGFFQNGQADLRTFFGWHPWLYLFIVPAISMRLWAEERRNGTIELLFTLPVTLFEAVVGKFIAAWIFIGCALVLTFPLVLTVIYLGDPDPGPIIASYLGSFLMAGAYLAVGCFVSTMTSNQVISFVISTALCLVLILIGYGPFIETLLTVFPTTFVDLLANLSFPYHFESIQRGVVELNSMVYFLSMIMFFLISGAMVLEKSKGE